MVVVVPLLFSTGLSVGVGCTWELSSSILEVGVALNSSLAVRVELTLLTPEEGEAVLSLSSLDARDVSLITEDDTPEVRVELVSSASLVRVVLTAKAPELEGSNTLVFSSAFEVGEDDVTSGTEVES